MEWWQTLISVAVGALLAPWLTYRLDTQRKKRHLKPQLVKLLYQFFNYRKTLIRESNVLHYTNAYSSFVWDDLTREPDKNSKSELEFQFNNLDKSIFYLRENTHRTLNQLIETESEIMSQLTEIKSLYGNRAYNQVVEKIQPHLDFSNKSPLIYKFSKLSRAELMMTRDDLTDKLDNKAHSMQDECSLLIKELNTIF